MITLAAGEAVAQVFPAMGAGLASLVVAGRPALRGWAGHEADGPFALGLNLLAPFSNRIAGGFAFQGTRYALPPNLAGEPCAIHGDAFQRGWQVTAQTPATATLTLRHGAIGPFRYHAEVRYALTATALRVRLRLTSDAALPLPHGLGFHPWFPRSPETRLQFAASGHWPEGPGHLPQGTAPVPPPPDWQFARPRPLPNGWINTAFTGWDGHAAIRQGDGAQSLRIIADGLDTAILYSPSATAPFFCFEPVSHAVNAHNMPGQPGLVVLAPGDSMARDMTLEWM